MQATQLSFSFGSIWALSILQVGSLTEQVSTSDPVLAPVLFSYSAEVQTFSMRSKGMLIWNAVTQIEYVYTTFVDAVALDAIGQSCNTDLSLRPCLTFRIQVLRRVHPAGSHSVDSGQAM